MKTVYTPFPELPDGPFFDTLDMAALGGALWYFSQLPVYGPYTHKNPPSPVPGTDYGDGFTQWDVAAYGTPTEENNHSGFGTVLRIHRVDKPDNFVQYRHRDSSLDISFAYSASFVSIEAAASWAGRVYFEADEIGSIGTITTLAPNNWRVQTFSDSEVLHLVDVFANRIGEIGLPELTLPPGLPCWLAAGHSVESDSIYANTQMRSGHARRRRAWDAGTRTVTVSLALEESQMRRFFAWYEGPLRAGAEPFAAHVPNQGPGLLWWHARFVDPPAYQARELGRWRVSAKLLLSGSGSGTGPISSSLGSTSVIALYGSAGITVPKRFASESRIELLSASRLRSTSTIALLSAPPAGAFNASSADTAAVADSIDSGATVSAFVVEAAAVVDTPDSSVGGTASLAESAAASDAFEIALPASCVLDIQFEGADGSTSITDSRGHGVTVHGAVTISTAQVARGSSSGRFPGGSGDYLEIGTSSDWEFGTGDFAMRCKIRPDVVSGLRILATDVDNLTLESGWYWLLSGTDLQFAHFVNSSVSFGISGATLSAGVWQDVEVRRAGTTFSLLVDGSVVASTTSSVAMANTFGTLVIGYDPRTSGREFQGYIDSFRVFKGDTG